MWCYWLEIWNYQYKNKFDQLAALFPVFFLSLFASPVGLLLVVVVVVRLPASQVLFCIFSLRGSRWTPGAGCFTVHRTTNLDEFASLRDLAVFFLGGGKIFEFPTFFGTKRELTVSSPKKWPFFWVGSRLLACVSSCWAMSMRREKIGIEKVRLQLEVEGINLEILFRPFWVETNFTPPNETRMFGKTVRKKCPKPKWSYQLTVPFKLPGISPIHWKLCWGSSKVGKPTKMVDLPKYERSLVWVFGWWLDDPTTYQ